MAEIQYLTAVGSMMQVHYTDGAISLAYPDGRGHYLPRSGAAPVDPGDPPEPTTGDWVHPLAGSTMTSPYGPRAFDGVGSFHWGIDFSTGGGGTIVAPTDLKVTIARAGWGSGGSAGNCVKAHTTDGAYTFNFYHMVSGSIAVTEGQTISRGTTIGIEGETGNAYGAHLHFEVYEGIWNDPWPPPYNYGANCIDPGPLLTAHGVTY